MSETNQVPGLVVPAHGEPGPSIAYVPPVLDFQILKQLERMTELLESIDAKLGQPAAAPVAQIEKEQCVIYVTWAQVQDDMYVTSCELYRGQKKLNAWRPVHKKDPLQSLLLAVYTALGSLGIGTRSDSPVLIISDDANLTPVLTKVQNTTYVELLTDIHARARAFGGFATLTDYQSPIMQELILETHKIGEKLCSQLQEQHS